MNSNYNIIYLIGAGASAQEKFDKLTCLPLADKFSNYIHEFCDFNKPFYYPIEREELKEFTSGFNEFAKHISKFNTIDESMRKLYLNEEFDKFEYYKKLISIVFYILEIIHLRKDTRYEQFLLTLINDDFDLPDNIFILSWNYDNQFELSAESIYNNKSNLITLKRGVNFHKINGSASFFSYVPDIRENVNRYQRDFKSNLMDIKSIINRSSEIKFAWERNVLNEESMEEKLIQFIENIKSKRKGNILVTIGYSFPYVNSKYDSLIFRELKPAKVFVQDIITNDVFYNDIFNRFIRFYTTSNNIIRIPETNRFYLPPELY